MGNINDGGPAFPCGPSGMSISYDDGRTEHQYPGSPGMSLRDWFAGQALQGILAGGSGWNSVSAEVMRNEGIWGDVSTTEIAYRFADAMIAAREAKNGN